MSSCFFPLQLALSPASAIRSANCSAVGRCWAWLRAVGRRRCRPLAVALGGPGSVLSWAIVGVRAKKPSRGLVFSFPLLYLCGRWVACRCGRQWPGGSPQRISRCSKLIAIKLCAISEMHGKVRRESVAGYATDETLVCGPKEHTRWWQRYGRHLQGLLYRLILNSYLSSFVLCWQKYQPLPNRQPTASLRHSRGKGSRQRRLLTSMTLSSITASPHS